MITLNTSKFFISNTLHGRINEFYIFRSQLVRDVLVYKIG